MHPSPFPFQQEHTFLPNISFIRVLQEAELYEETQVLLET